LDRKPTVGLDKLFQLVGYGKADTDVASTIAGRLARLDQRLPKEDLANIADLAGGRSLGEIAHGIVEALDPDRQLAEARAEGGSQDDHTAVEQAANKLIAEALQPLAANPELRTAILDARKSFEQIIDEAAKDALLEARPSAEARERAAATVQSFREYIEEHKDEIRALQILYSRPYTERLTFDEVKELANAIKRPPHQWTPERLWHAYEMLDSSKVRGSGGKMLTDIVALVRFALEQENELVPFHEQVEQRFQAWLLSQEQKGVGFSDQQLQWLTWMKENIASEMRISPDSFEYTPFAEHGGIGKAVQVFGERLTPLTDELTEVLAA
jgi:type I restriction enzyme R subunit